jgi:hypothetical protein
MTKIVTVNGRKWNISDNIAQIENRGRTLGSKNKITMQRDEAIRKGVEFRNSEGLSLLAAASKVIDEFGLVLTVEHMAKLIGKASK